MLDPTTTTETPQTASSPPAEPKGSIAQLQRGRLLISDLSIAWEYRLICHDPRYALLRTGPMSWTVYRGEVRSGRPVGAIMPWWRQGEPRSYWRLVASHRGRRFAEGTSPGDLPRLLRSILEAEGALELEAALEGRDLNDLERA